MASVVKLYNRNRLLIRTLSYGIDYTEDYIEYDLQEADSTFSFTILGQYVPLDVEAEGYIETEEQFYVIKEINQLNVVCRLNMEELKAWTIERFTASDQQSIAVTAQAALEGTEWTVSSFVSEEKSRSVQQFKKTPYELIMKIRDAWMCEVKFDTKNRIVYFADQFGSDRGTFFINGLNLKSATLSIDSYDFATRIYPIGQDGLTIEEVNDGSPYLENHQYSNKVITVTWEDSNYEDPQALKDDAQAKLEELSKPRRAYSAKVRDLKRINRNTQEYLEDELDETLLDELEQKLTDQEVYSVFAFGPGDTVKIISKPDMIKDKQRIVKMTVYPDDPEQNSIELANSVLTWEDMQSRLQAAADAWEDVSNADGSVNGVYVRGVQAGEVVGIEVVVNDNVSLQNFDLSKINIRGTSDSLIACLNGTATTPAASTQKKALSVKEAGLKAEAPNYDTLDGAIIKPKSVKAEQIDVENLFAQNINATGTINGAKLTGATGSFSGEVNATSGSFNGQVTAKRLTAKEQFTLYTADNESSGTPVLKLDDYSTVAVEYMKVGFVDGDIDSPILTFEKSHQGGGTDGAITTDSIVYATVVEPSDARLKKNIKSTEIQNATEMINHIRMRSFDWKKTGKHQKIGIIADELEELDPDLITGGEGHFKGVSGYYLLCYLTKAVQELSNRVKELEDTYEH